MLKKQNCDPNRSTYVLSSNNMIEKRLHNSSLKTISSTQQSYSINNKKDQNDLINNKKDQNDLINNKKSKEQVINFVQSRQKNKNSRILAEIKQSKQVMMTKRQGIKSTNISTTRSNYKPKFILKQRINQQNYHNQQNLNQYQNQYQYQQQQNQYQQQQNQYQQQQNQYQYQYQQSQHQQQQEYSHQRQSLCQDYYQSKHLSKQNHNTFCNTFNNSPLGSESCYKLTKRSKPQQQPKIHVINQQKPQKRPIFTYQHDSNIKSPILSKRTQYQPEDKTIRNTNEQNNDQNLNNLNKPLQMKGFNKQKLREKDNKNNMRQYQNNNRRQQQNNKNRRQQFLQDENLQQQYPSQVQQYEMYEQASTVEYPRKLFNKKGREQSQQSESEGYEFESRLKSISSTNPFREKHKQMRSISISNKQMRSISINNTNESFNYKTAYLQTKKQLQIRSAYFNQAIQLCKHIIGNMKLVMEEEYAETQSDRVMWCHQNCQDILQAFQQWTQK